MDKFKSEKLQRDSITGEGRPPTILRNLPLGVQSDSEKNTLEFPAREGEKEPS